MKKIIFVCLTLFLVTGCVPVLIGTGLVTGYTLTNDSIVGNLNIEYSSLWDLCLKKLEKMEATLIRSDKSKGIIKSEIGDSDVVIKINSLDTKLQRLRVSARKYFLPKPDFAEKVFLTITKDIK